MSAKANQKPAPISAALGSSALTPIAGARKKSEHLARVSAQLSEIGHNAPELLALEPRMMLDAAGMDTAEAVLNEEALRQAEAWAESMQALNTKAQTDNEDADIDDAVANGSTRTEILFVDEGVEDYRSIIDGAGANVEVHVITSDKDGVEQMAQVLEGRLNIDAIHIVSHGEAGALELGSTQLTQASIAGQHADEMAMIKGVLSENADILIYGCDFGSGTSGASAIAALAEATGADIAASDDLTGARELGGDWDLEVVHGQIETDAEEFEEFLDVLGITATDDTDTKIIAGVPITIDPRDNDTSDAGDISITGVEIAAGTIHDFANDGAVATIAATGTIVELRADGRLKVTAAAGAGADGFANTESINYTIQNTSSETDTGQIDLQIGTPTFADAAAIGFVATVDTYNYTYGNQGDLYLFAEDGLNNYKVVWADGTVQDYTSNSEHWIHRNFGTRTEMDFAIVGDFSGFDFYNSNGSNANGEIVDGNGNIWQHSRDLQEIKQWGNIAWQNLENAFYQSQVKISATDSPDLTNITSLHGMFHNAYMTVVDGGTLANWDVSGIEDFGDMFNNSPAFNDDLSKWDTSSATSMYNMFANARAFNSDLNTKTDPDTGQVYWDVSNVTNMRQMFYDANAFNSDLDNWDVSNVTDFYRMFFSAGSFNGSMAGWDLSSATTVERMFETINANFNADMSDWKIGTVDADGNGTASMRYMFYNTWSFGSDTINTWDVSAVNDMLGTFQNSYNFNHNLNQWDTGNVTTMQNMFYEARTFNGDITTWDTSKVTNMIGMFQQAYDFNQDIDTKAGGGYSQAGGANSVDAWDVSSVTNMSNMFYNSHHPNARLGNYEFNQTIENWDVSNVLSTANMFYSHYGVARFQGEMHNMNFVRLTNATNMFYNNDQLTADMTNWEIGTAYLDANGDNDGTAVTLNAMFNNTNNFGGDLTTWDVSGVTNMSDMFINSYFGGPGPDVSTWDTRNVTNMARMFFDNRQFNTDINFKADGGHNANGDTVDAWDVSKVTNMQQMFYNNDAFVQDLNRWDVSSVQNFYGTFQNANNFNGDIENWNTASATNMSNMFRDAISFNRDISTKADGGFDRDNDTVDAWDMNGVLNTSLMFYNAQSFAQDIGNWDTSTVTNMSSMFYNADAFDIDISSGRFTTLLGGDSWDTKEVTTMRQMFDNANIFNQDIGNWDTSKVTDMAYMFRSALAFNQDIDTGNDTTPSGTPSWDVSNVTNMEHMFNAAHSFDTPIANWDTASLLQMFRMFDDAHAFNQPVDQLDTSGVTNMTGVFANTETFNQPINWDMAGVTNMYAMFDNADAFNHPSINDWNVSNVTNMSYMFRGTDIFNQPLTNWSTDSLTRMEYMFNGALAFNQSLNHFNVSGVTDMLGVFQASKAFNGDISDWDVSNVTRFENMFYDADAFNNDITNWDTSAGLYFRGMFNYADIFNQDISTKFDADGNATAWDMSNAITLELMFGDAINFNQDIGNWDTSRVQAMDSMFMRARAFDQYLGAWSLQSLVRNYQRTYGAAGTRNIGWRAGGNHVLSYSGMTWQNTDATLRAWAEQAQWGKKANVYLSGYGIEYYDAYWGAIEDLRDHFHFVTFTDLYSEAPDAVYDGVVYVPEDGSASGNVLDNDSDFDVTYTNEAIADAYSGSITGTFDDETVVTTLATTYTPQKSGTYTFTVEATDLQGVVDMMIGTTSGGNDVYSPDGSLDMLNAANNPVEISVFLEADTEYFFSFQPSNPGSEATGFTVNGMLNHFNESLSVTRYQVFSSALTNSNSMWVTAGTSTTIAGVGEFVINADGSYTFTPEADFDGDVPSIRYEVSDNRGGNYGIASKFDTAFLNFAMVSVNDAPEGANQNVTINEDTSFAFATQDGSVFGFLDAVDNDNFYSVIIETLPDPAEGVLELNGVAVVAGQQILRVDLENLIFTPVENINSKTADNENLGQFTFSVRDDGGMGNNRGTNLLLNGGIEGNTGPAWEWSYGEVNGQGGSGGADPFWQSSSMVRFNYSNWRPDGDAVWQTIETEANKNYAFDVKMSGNLHVDQTHYYTLNVYDENDNIIEKIDGQIEGFNTRDVTLEFTATTANTRVEIVSRPHPDYVPLHTSVEFRILDAGVYEVQPNLLQNPQFIDGAFDHSTISEYVNELGGTAGRISGTDGNVKTWEFTPSVTGNYVFGATGDDSPANSAYTYVGTSEGGDELLNQILTNRAYNNANATATLALTAGTTYYVTVDPADAGYVQEYQHAFHLEGQQVSGSLNSWTVIDNGNGNPPVLTTEASVLLNSGASDNAGNGIEQTVTLEAGKSYHFNAQFFETSSQNFNHTYQVELLDANGDVFRTITGQTLNNSSADADVSFTAPTDDVTIRITNQSGVNTTTSEMRLGDVSLTEKSDNEATLRGNSNLGANTLNTADGAWKFINVLGNDPSGADYDAGSERLRFNIDNTPIDSDAAEQVVSTRAGQTYQMSADFFARHGQPMDYRMEVLGENGQVLASVAGSAAARQSVPETLEFVATGEQVTIRIVNPANGQTGAGADLWVQNMSFKIVYNDTDTTPNTFDFTIVPVNDPQEFAEIPDQSGTDGEALNALDVSTYMSDEEDHDVVYNIDYATTPSWISISPEGVISGRPTADASQNSNIIGGADGEYRITVYTVDVSHEEHRVETSFIINIENDDVNGVDDTGATTEHGTLTGNVLLTPEAQIVDYDGTGLVLDRSNPTNDPATSSHYEDVSRFTIVRGGAYTFEHGYATSQDGGFSILKVNADGSVVTSTSVFYSGSDGTSRFNSGAEATQTVNVTLEDNTTYVVRAWVGGGGAPSGGTTDPFFTLTEQNPPGAGTVTGEDYDGNQVTPDGTVANQTHSAVLPDPVTETFPASTGNVNNGGEWSQLHSNGDEFSRSGNPYWLSGDRFMFNTSNTLYDGSVERSLGVFDEPGTYTMSYTTFGAGTANVAGGLTLNGEYYDGATVTTEVEGGNVTYIYTLELNKEHIDLGKEFGLRFEALSAGPNAQFSVGDFQLVSQDITLDSTSTAPFTYVAGPNATNPVDVGALGADNGWTFEGLNPDPRNWAADRFHFNGGLSTQSGIATKSIGTIEVPGTYTFSMEIDDGDNMPEVNAGFAQNGTLLAGQVAVEPVADGVQTWTYTLVIADGDPLIGQSLDIMIEGVQGIGQNVSIGNLTLDAPTSVQDPNGILHRDPTSISTTPTSTNFVTEPSGNWSFTDNLTDGGDIWRFNNLNTVTPPTEGSHIIHFHSGGNGSAQVAFHSLGAFSEPGRYEISIDVGNYSSRPFPALGPVGLTIGGTDGNTPGTVIDAQIVSGGTPAGGEWETWTFTLDIGADDALLGQDIGFMWNVPKNGVLANMAIDNLRMDHYGYDYVTTQTHTYEDALIVSQVGGSDAGVGTAVAGTNADTTQSGGTFTIESDGSYAFNAGDDFDYLEVGQTATTSVEYQVSDGQGGFDTATLTITITGENDGTVTAENADGLAATAGANETTNGSAVTMTATASFTDVDLDDTVYSGSAIGTVALSGETAGLDTLTNAQLLAFINSVTFDKSEGSNSGTMDVNFNAGSTVFDYLTLGETVTLEYTIQIDNDGITEDVQIAFTVTGTNDAPLVAVSGGFAARGTVNEPTDNSQLQTTLTANFTDVDLNDTNYSSSISNIHRTGIIDGIASFTDEQLEAMLTNVTFNTTAGSNAGTIDAEFTAPAGMFDYLAKGERVDLQYQLEIDNGGLKQLVTFEFSIIGTNDEAVIDSITNISANETTDTSNITGSNRVEFTDLDLRSQFYQASVTAATTSGETGGLALTEAQLQALIGNLTVTKAVGSTDGSIDPRFTANSTHFDYLATGETVEIEYTLKLAEMEYGDPIDVGGGFVIFPLVEGPSSTETFTVTITGTNDGPVITQNATAGVNETTDTSGISATATATFTDVDLNDASYTATLSSVTTAGENAGLAGVTDAQLEAMFSNLTINTTNGSNTATIEADFDAASTVFDYLATGETVDVIYTVELNDNGIKRDVTFTYTITGTNDAPIVTSVANANATESTDTSNITASASIEFGDVDLNDVGHTASITAVARAGEIAGLTSVADADLLAMIGNLAVTKNAASNTGSLAPSFTAASTVFDYLAVGETVTLTYTVEINDGDGGTVNEEFDVTITGTNDDLNIDAIAGVSVAESVDASDTTVSVPVTFSDVDLNDTAYRASVIGAATAGQVNGLATVSEADLIAMISALNVTKNAGSADGTIEPNFAASSTVFDYLAVGQSVDITYTLQVEQLADPNDPDSDVLSVDTQTFTITVTGTNDAPRQIGEVTEVFVEGAEMTPFDLNPYFTDVDTGDTFTWFIDPADLPEGLTIDNSTGVISGTPANDLSVTGDGGKDGDRGPAVHAVKVTATDSQGEIAEIEIDLEFMNPPPEVTAGIGPVFGIVGLNLTFDTTSAFTDPDADVLTYSATDLPLGLSIDPATGIISGEIDDDAFVDSPFPNGTYVATITVTDAQGESVSTELEINVREPVSLEELLELFDEADAELLLELLQHDPKLLALLDQFLGERAIEAAADANTLVDAEIQTEELTIDTPDGGQVKVTLIKTTNNTFLELRTVQRDEAFVVPLPGEAFPAPDAAPVTAEQAPEPVRFMTASVLNNTTTTSSFGKNLVIEFVTRREAFNVPLPPADFGPGPQ